MKQGNVYWVKLDKVNSKYKTRPCIIISNDTTCKYADTVQVIPLKSYHNQKTYDTDVIIKSGKIDRLAICNTTIRVNKKHISNFDSNLESFEFVQVKQAMVKAYDLGGVI